jgi:hypothetical protein
VCSMADLARIRQQVRETTKQYIMRFKRAKVRCQVNILLESEFVKLGQDGLDFERADRFDSLIGQWHWNDSKHPFFSFLV